VRTLSCVDLKNRNGTGVVVPVGETSFNFVLSDTYGSNPIFSSNPMFNERNYHFEFTQRFDMAAFQFRFHTAVRCKYCSSIFECGTQTLLTHHALVGSLRRADLIINDALNHAMLRLVRYVKNRGETCRECYQNAGTRGLSRLERLAE